MSTVRPNSEGVWGSVEPSRAQQPVRDYGVAWSNLIKAVVIVAMTALILARDGDRYDAYTRGAFTMLAFVVTAYLVANFVQSVWLTALDRRAARREVA